MCTDTLLQLNNFSLLLLSLCIFKILLNKTITKKKTRGSSAFKSGTLRKLEKTMNFVNILLSFRLLYPKGNQPRSQLSLKD